MTSNAGAIPDWGFDSYLPAFDVDNPTSRDRSPYEISVFDLAAGFGNTDPRRHLLRGLLDFRAELHQAGFHRGFQWINGSFVENDGARQNQAPNDIDIVTFFHIPNEHTGETLLQDFPELFDQSDLKRNYSVDAYYVQLNQTTSEEIINESTYWYSLWSHTRNGQWKGYLRIDLADEYDDQARSQLDLMDGYAGGQE